MGYYAGFKYGSGVLYGVTTTITGVDPDEGPAPGENDFVITGVGFDPRQWDDHFTDALLNVAKWTDLSAGGGAVTTGTNHLQLSTSAVAGASAGVQSVAQWGPAQGEARITVAPTTVYPAADVDVFVFSLWVDASNYSKMYLRMTSTGVMTLYCEVYAGGVLSDWLKAPLAWTSGLSIFKILRFGSAVYFYANGSLLFRSVKFVNTVGYFQMYSQNLTALYDVDLARVEWFYYRPFAVFQSQPVHDSVVVSDGRLRGVVPASRDDLYQSAAYEGSVDVSVVGNGPATDVDAYRYYYIDGLTSIDSVQADVTMSLVNDEQLVTPSGVNKGLGEGY